MKRLLLLSLLLCAVPVGAGSQSLDNGVIAYMSAPYQCPICKLYFAGHSPTVCAVYHSDGHCHYGERQITKEEFDKTDIKEQPPIMTGGGPEICPDGEWQESKYWIYGDTIIYQPTKTQISRTHFDVCSSNGLLRIHRTGGKK